jgi:hypothetical protein
MSVTRTSNGETVQKVAELGGEKFWKFGSWSVSEVIAVLLAAGLPSSHKLQNPK